MVARAVGTSPQTGACGSAPHAVAHPAPCTREDAVAAYLREMAAEPFRWSASDCATFGIGWAERLAGRKAVLVEPLPKSLSAFVRRQRRLPLSQEVGAVLCGLGFVPVFDGGKPGDIGVGFVDGLPTVLIRARTGWAGRAERGLVTARFTPAAIWRAP
jgi:hypothetical protein